MTNSVLFMKRTRSGDAHQARACCPRSSAGREGAWGSLLFAWLDVNASAVRPTFNDFPCLLGECCALAQSRRRVSRSLERYLLFMHANVTVFLQNCSPMRNSP